MVFLPRTDLGAQERCRIIVETEILRFGHTILGWRQVPVDISVIGEKANETRPEIEQILIGRGDSRLDNREFEKQLYILRRRIEKAAIAENIAEFYVCSLSCRSVVYKGMFLAEHLSAFYPDLLDERFTSRFAIFHQRYSTNTFPQWKLAQPFRVLAHNGEINTHPGQRQLDEEPRGAPRPRGLRPLDRGPEADHPARRARTPRRSTTCSSCWCAAIATCRWSRR